MQVPVNELTVLKPFGLTANTVSFKCFTKLLLCTIVLPKFSFCFPKIEAAKADKFKMI